jgi:hypothetical protein
MSTDIRREAEELVRYHSELVRRLAQTGVRDIPELLALHDRVCRALGSVSRQEIAWAAEQAESLRTTLVALGASLEAISRLKSAVEAPAGAVETGRRAS